MSRVDDEALADFVEGDIYGGEGLSLDAAFRISAADIKHVNTTAGSQKCANYGEVLLSSWATILDACQVGPDDVFVDLGSGRGTLVFFAMLRGKGLKKSVGVELSRERI